jgi:UDP-glucose 4-epimerase
VLGDAHGAFNVATDPVLDADAVAHTLGARPVQVPRRLARAAMAVTWRLRLQPSQPGRLDMGLGVPLMDTTRIRTQLGWRPRTTSYASCSPDCGREQASPTPPLTPAASGRLRVPELLTLAGTRERA